MVKSIWLWGLLIFLLASIALAIADGRAQTATLDGDMVVNGQPGNEQDFVVWYGARTVPVTMYYDPQGELWPVPDSLIQQALTEWNEVTPGFRYIYGGRLIPGSAMGKNNCGSTPPNGTNSISWFPISGRQVLGRSCIWSTSEECDIELANDQPQWLTNPEDFRTILLHEAGHCLGLGHSADPTAVMYAAYKGPNHIQPDDANGVCSLYGGPCEIPQPQTPTPTHTSTRPPPTVTPTPDRRFRVVGPEAARD